MLDEGEDFEVVVAGDVERSDRSCDREELGDDITGSADVREFEGGEGGL